MTVNSLGQWIPLDQKPPAVFDNRNQPEICKTPRINKVRRVVVASLSQSERETHEKRASSVKTLRRARHVVDSLYIY